MVTICRRCLFNRKYRRYADLLTTVSWCVHIGRRHRTSMLAPEHHFHSTSLSSSFIERLACFEWRRIQMKTNCGTGMTWVLYTMKTHRICTNSTAHAGRIAIITSRSAIAKRPRDACFVFRLTSSFIRKITQLHLWATLWELASEAI